jgi:hypothetical protein
MAPRRILAWRTLTVGLVAIATLVGAALWVLLVARVGALHGDSYHLYVLAGDARGIITGTEVWLEGQKVGLVSGVRVRPISADTARRVAIEVEVLREYQPQIRGNSRAQLRHAGSPIGAPVIYLTAGTPAAPVLEDGDSIAITPHLDADELKADLAAASAEVPGIIYNVRAIRRGVRRMTARIRTDTALHQPMANLRRGFARLRARVDASYGSRERSPRDTAAARPLHRDRQRHEGEYQQRDHEPADPAAPCIECPCGRDQHRVRQPAASEQHAQQRP